MAVSNVKIKHGFALKWIGISFAIKGSLFILFAVLFNQNWPRELIVNHLFVVSGDTGGYYDPIESFVDSGNYDSFCRMPGLLPIYAPLYYLFGSVWGKTFVIILQFIASTISVYFLAQTAAQVFKNKSVFYLTFGLYSLSNFVSNWDHYGYSDSFGVSFLIYAVYFATKFKYSKERKYLLWSAIFMAWSVFFRPVHGALVPIIMLVCILDQRQWMKTISNCVIFVLPMLLALSVWTFDNYKKYQKIIVLQGPVSECFGSLTPELLAIRGLMIGWGGDYQPWSKGSEAEWFLEKKKVIPDKKAIPDSYLTSAYNYDSLLLLRNEYRAFTSDTLQEETKKAVGDNIIKRSELYLSTYKKERVFSYYFLNRIKILKQLLFPKRLDDFPTPAFNAMNLFHKVLKSFYFLLFLFINVTGLIGCLQKLINGNYFALIPLAILVLIGCVFGYVEQRYLCPVYPFLVIYSATFLLWLRNKLILKKKANEPGVNLGN